MLYVLEKGLFFIKSSLYIVLVAVPLVLYLRNHFQIQCHESFPLYPFLVVASLRLIFGNLSHVNFFSF